MKVEVKVRMKVKVKVEVRIMDDLKKTRVLVSSFFVIEMDFNPCCDLPR